MEQVKLIEKLAAGYSTQSKTANQFWLVLIIASIIALTGKAGVENLIELPFTLGKVDIYDFYSVSTILISVLVIAFTSAMIQTIRTRMLIQKEIESIAAKDRFIGQIHIQDYLDSILTPTYNRVGPISQFLLGRNQFLGQKRPNKFLRAVGVILYSVLKLSTFFFMYFVPVIAMFKCYGNLKSIAGGIASPIISCFLIILIALSLISILILFVGDVRYLARVVKHLRN